MVERFSAIENVAARSGVVVFVIYNINTPTRMGKHPIPRDFPSDCYYRLFNIVQLLYRPTLFYDNDYDKDILEVITVKGALKNP